MSGRAVKVGDLVCITGGSGFIGSWIIELLLSKGYRVRCVVRDAKNTSKYEFLKKMQTKEGQLEFTEGEIGKPYFDVVKGCDAVIHLASPYQYTAADPQKEIVDPAVEGVRSMLEACYATPSVKRVVLTSSGGSIVHFPVAPGYQFTEKDWNTTSSLTNNPYFYSKKLAEEAGWNIYNAKKDQFDFVVVNPLLVLGPTKTNNLNASQANILKKIFTGEALTIQSIPVGVTDVRDVATAHLIALENAEAVGHRLICYSASTTFNRIGREMKKQFPEYPVTPAIDDEAPTWTMDTSILKKLGLTEFITFEKMLHDTLESFINVGAVPDLRKK